MMKTKYLAAGCMAGLLAALTPVQEASAAILVDFDTDPVQVLAGEVFTLGIFYDADLLTEGRQALAEGLFQFALHVTFDETAFTGIDFVGSPGIDSHGFFDQAAPTFGSGFIGLDAYVPFTESNLFTGTRLATVTLQAPAAEGTHTLSLARMYEGTISNFTTGNYVDVDETVTFGQTTVNVVIPEPVSLGLLPLAVGWTCRRRNRMI